MVMVKPLADGVNSVIDSLISGNESVFMSILDQNSFTRVAAVTREEDLDRIGES